MIPIGTGFTGQTSGVGATQPYRPNPIRTTAGVPGAPQPTMGNNPNDPNRYSPLGQGQPGGSPGNTFVNTTPGTTAAAGNTYLNNAPGTPPGLPMTPTSTWGGSQGNTFVNSVQGGSPTSVTPGSTLDQIQHPAPVPTTPGTAAVSAPGLGSPPAPGGAATGLPQTQTFDSTKNLIGTQINPSESPLDSQYRNLMSNAANTVANAPDRNALALSQFNTFTQATDPAYQGAIRDATKAAAANGGIGSGMLSNNYGTIAEQRARDLDVAKQGYMQNALDQSIQDRYQSLGALSGAQSQQFGQDQATQNALRGERGYQYGLSSDATNNAINASNAAYNQGMGLTSAGFGYDPSQTLLAGSASSGQDAGQAFGALGQIQNTQAQSNILNQLYGPNGIYGRLLGGGGSPAPTTTSGSTGTGGYTPVPGTNTSGSSVFNPSSLNTYLSSVLAGGGR